MTPLDIVFVSSHPRPKHFRSDGSFIYRCENLGLGLAALGHRVSHRHLNSLVTGATRFDVAMFMRPNDSLRFRWVARRLRKAGCRLVADFDDLVFDPELARFRPSVWLGQTSLAPIQRKFRRHEAVLPLFDRFTFSTEELASRFGVFRPTLPSAIIPNAAFRPWRELPRLDTQPRRITYFSGTRTHDRDFAMVEPALARLLSERNDFRLQIVGPLSCGLAHPSIDRVDRVDFAQYADLVRASHLNIAPLEDTPFNRCKSALKVIEAGCFGVPTVASPIGDFLRVATEGVLYAAGEEQWYTQMRDALDATVYARLSEGLANRLRPYSDVDVFAREFLRFVTES